MFLRQKCIVIAGLELNYDIHNLSAKLGVPSQKLKTIKKQIDFLNKENYSNFRKTCLEIQNFDAPQSKLKLLYIQKLLLKLILKFDRWARRANYLNKDYDKKSNKKCNSTVFRIDTKLILHIWLSLKNLICHHPRVSYDGIHKKANSLKFLNHEKYDLRQNIIGPKPPGEFLLKAFNDLKSKSHLKTYF